MNINSFTDKVLIPEATSQNDSDRRQTYFRHSSVPDPRYTSKDWRRGRDGDDKGIGNAGEDDNNMVFEGNFNSEDAIRNMPDEDIIRMVKQMAKKEPLLLDSCIHDASNACDECCEVTFKSSSFVSGEKQKPDPRLEMIARRLNVGKNRNANYQGSITLFDVLNSFASDEDNSSLYLTRLPRNITTREVYAHIKHGAIHSSSLMLPKFQHQQYAAMRIVFMTRSGAEALLNQTKFLEGLKIGGKRIEAFWNRERVGPAALARYKNMTRVLRVEAPAGDIDMDGTLLPLLEQSIKFELIEKSQKLFTTSEGVEMKSIVLHFSSIRGQADSAYVLLKQLRMSKAKRRNEIDIFFDRDPCDSPNGENGDLVHAPETSQRAPPVVSPSRIWSAWRQQPPKS